MGNFSPLRFGQLYAKSQSTYDATLSASAIVSGNFPIEVEMFLPPTAAREVHERTAVRSGYHALAPISGSPYGGTFSLRFPMHGWQADPGSPAITGNPTANPEVLFLQQVLGGLNAGNYLATGTDNSDGGDTTVINIDAATSASSLAVGNGILVKDAAAAYMIAFAKTYTEGTPDTIAPLVPMPGSPEAATVLYGTQTAFLSTDQPVAISMLWRSLDNNTRLRLGGCVATSASLTMSPKEPLMMEVSFICNAIVQDSDSSSLTNIPYALPVLPVPMGNSAARLSYVAGAAAVPFDVANFEISIDTEGTPQLAHGAETGVNNYVVTNRTVSATFTSLLSGASTGGTVNPWDQTPDGKPIVDLSAVQPTIQLEVGSVVGNMMGIAIPAATMMTVPELVDQDGLLGATFTVEPGNYVDDGTTAAEAAADSDFRVAIG